MDGESRHWTARIAGGSVRGNAGSGSAPIGRFSRTAARGRRPRGPLASSTRPASGRHRQGLGQDHPEWTQPRPDRQDPGQGRPRPRRRVPRRVAGFKELDRFLGAARGGGLFEDGDLHGTIYNRTLFIEQLTLERSTGPGPRDRHGHVRRGLEPGSPGQHQPGHPSVRPGAGEHHPWSGSGPRRGEETFLRIAGFLENRLLKFRVTGSIDNPNVQLDPGVAVGDAAVGFFSSVLKVPIGSGRRSN